MHWEDDIINPDGELQKETPPMSLELMRQFAINMGGDPERKAREGHPDPVEAAMEEVCGALTEIGKPAADGFVRGLPEFGGLSRPARRLVLAVASQVIAADAADAANHVVELGRSAEKLVGNLIFGDWWDIATRRQFRDWLTDLHHAGLTLADE